jgi:type IX secretion system PorP/SprF family membrane protein
LKLFSQVIIAMKKFVCTFPFLIIVHLFAYAQQLPTFSHYYINPYVYNPALAGVNGYNEVYLTHRRQWMGVEGAPVTSDLSVHLPRKGKMAYGFRVSNYSRGLLSTTSGVFTVAYTAKLADDQYLRAGLSGGLGTNGIDLEKVENISDPALSNIRNRGMFFDGNAGVSYQYKKLTIGASLPKLFQRNVVQTNLRNQLEVKRLDHYLFSAGYKFDFSQGSIVFEPQIVYQIADGIPSQLEVLGTVYFYDKFWAGAAYRHNNGPSAFAGIKLSDKLRFSYVYEMGPSKISGYSGGSHEIMLSMRFGNRKWEERKSVSKSIATASHRKSPAEKLKEAKDAYIEKELAALPGSQIKENAKNKPGTSAKKKITSEDKQSFTPAPEESSVNKKFDGEVAGKPEEKIIVQKKEHPMELEKGYYVVVSAFRIFDNAMKYHEYLSDTYFESRFGFSSKSLYYYTYVLYTKDINKARFERDKLRKMKGFADTWVLIVE